MSRHTLQKVDNRTTIVGWDNALETFFCQDYENYDSPDEILVWSIGESEGEIPTPCLCVQKLEMNGYEVPMHIYDVLKSDFSNRTEPTPLQKMMKNYLKAML
jgi:hypothetical protein